MMMWWNKNITVVAIGIATLRKNKYRCNSTLQINEIISLLGDNIFEPMLPMAVDVIYILPSLNYTNLIWLIEKFPTCV